MIEGDCFRESEWKKTENQGREIVACWTWIHLPLWDKWLQIVCARICVCEHEAERMHFSLNVQVHLCKSILHRMSCMPIGPWEPHGLLILDPISLCDLKTSPCLLCYGPQLLLRNKITERVAASQFILKEHHKLGWLYRLLSNGLLWGKNRVRGGKMTEMTGKRLAFKK